MYCVFSLYNYSLRIEILSVLVNQWGQDINNIDVILTHTEYSGLGLWRWTFTLNVFQRITSHGCQIDEYWRYIHYCTCIKLLYIPICNLQSQLKIWLLITWWESGPDSQPTFIVIVLMASLCMSNLSMGQFLSKFQTIIFESAPPVTNACPVSNKNIVITLTLKLIGSRDKKIHLFHEYDVQRSFYELFEKHYHCKTLICAPRDLI